MTSLLDKKLSQYKQLLIKWGKVINLVAPSTLSHIESRHFQDSLQLLSIIPSEAKTLFDIGSGAGFPGLILAMASPDISVHLIESDQKKCSFLATVSRETDTPVLIHTARVKDVNISALPDVVTARALASLSELLEMTARWWQENPDLVCIFPKGAKADDEIAEALKLYKFSVETIPSQTDPVAKILILRNISKA